MDLRADRSTFGGWLAQMKNMQIQIFTPRSFLPNTTMASAPPPAAIALCKIPIINKA
jgi:hypothetical protein